MYMFDRPLVLDFIHVFGGTKESPSPWYPRIEAAMQLVVGFHHCRFGKSNLTSPRGLNVWSIHLVNRLERLPHHPSLWWDEKTTSSKGVKKIHIILNERHSKKKHNTCSTLTHQHKQEGRGSGKSRFHCRHGA